MNVRRANEPTHFLLAQATIEVQQAGLLHDSVVSCTNLATVHEARIERVIGHLPDAVMQRDAGWRACLVTPDFLALHGVPAGVLVRWAKGDIHRRVI